MSKLKSFSTTAIAILISTSVWAQDDDSKQDSSEMPMMTEGNGNMMMDPQMMEKMMHRMMYQMSAMEHGHDHDQGYGDNHGMPMMGGGKGNMMNPQMMQMRMQHMTNMEQRLESIESLLSQLVELQKPQ